MTQDIICQWKSLSFYFSFGANKAVHLHSKFNTSQNPSSASSTLFPVFQRLFRLEYNRLSFNKYSPKSKKSQYSVDFAINMLSNWAETQVPLMSCIFSREKVYS